jgi:hypothetical protein
MDRSSGGVDSAEDSGSSQRYHNSLPGISKACSPTTMFSWAPFTLRHVCMYVGTTHTIVMLGSLYTLSCLIKCYFINSFCYSGDLSGDVHDFESQCLHVHQGSARQLFERLQGPFEEENLKGNFEKIIRLMQQVHSRHRQVLSLNFQMFFS